MSAVPAETASMPADEPSPETSTATSGLSSWKDSPDCSAMGRRVVDPLTLSCSAPREFAGTTERRSKQQGQRECERD